MASYSQSYALSQSCPTLAIKTLFSFFYILQHITFTLVKLDYLYLNYILCLEFTPFTYNTSVLTPST